MITIIFFWNHRFNHAKFSVFKHQIFAQSGVSPDRRSFEVIDWCSVRLLPIVVQVGQAVGSVRVLL